MAIDRQTIEDTTKAIRAAGWPDADGLVTYDRGDCAGFTSAIDSLILTLVRVRQGAMRVDGMSEKYVEGLEKRVRRALGYAYP